MIALFSYPPMFGDGREYEMFRYPGGEVQVRLSADSIEQIKQADRIHVIARITNGEIMALAQLTSAIDGVTNGEKDKTLILPYFPYSRADRRFVPGDCFGLEAFGGMIDFLGYERVATLDGHSKVLYSTGANVFDVSPIPIIRDVVDDITEIRGGVHTMLPDKGAARYGIKAPFTCEKIRDPKTGHLSRFKVPTYEEMSGVKALLIIDDICDGGGTFVGIAKEMETYGIPLYLYVSHGIFSQGITHLCHKFSKIYTTNSIDNYYGTLPGSRIKVYDCLPTILADLGHYEDYNPY